MGQNHFQSHHQHRHARTGSLRFPRRDSPAPIIPTPHLLPVVNFMTGTTANGGGLWKYLLQELLHQNRPVMTPALHFLDFRLTPKEVQDWIRRGVLSTYQETYRKNGWAPDYTAPVFMDSGGYKYLTKEPPDLTPFKTEPDEPDWETVLRIQDGLGGDAYIPLDYPIGPSTDDPTAEQRLEMGLQNALAFLQALSRRRPVPPVYLPCHGRTPDEMRRNVARLFEKLSVHGLVSEAIGVGIGSLVPLRVAGQVGQVISLIRAAREGIPESLVQKTPIHVFGISGVMIPVLAYLGVDTFDSATYIQSARSLSYLVPGEREWRYQPFMTLDAARLPCTCPHCANTELSLRKMQEILSNHESRVQFGGYFKSQVYAQIALHDLHHQLALTEQTRAAIAADAIEEVLIEQAARFRQARPAVELLAQENPRLAAGLTRKLVAVTATAEAPGLAADTIDLNKHNPGLPPWRVPGAAAHTGDKHTPDSFQVPDAYRPPGDKRVLLILPEPDTRPYRHGQSHRLILDRLASDLPEASAIHRVTLSGLYGPVPEEFEDWPAVLEYRFRLRDCDQVQIGLCSVRLTSFLRQYGSHYTSVIGYATERSYRMVLMSTAAQFKDLLLLPAHPAMQHTTEMFRREHLSALVEEVDKTVNKKGQASPGPPDCARTDG